MSKERHIGKINNPTIIPINSILVPIWVIFLVLASLSNANLITDSQIFKVRSGTATVPTVATKSTTPYSAVESAFVYNGIKKNEISFETSLKQVLKQKDYKKVEPVIKKLANEEMISIQEVMDLTHKSRTTAWRYMQILVECGAVEAVGNTNNVSYKKL